MKINKYIDHTLLKPTATIEDIKVLCQEAMEYNFFSVCVNSAQVANAARFLKENSEVKICSVIGFPLGAMHKDSKVFEAKKAIENGAVEIDMVINIGLLKSGQNQEVKEEIHAIKKAIGDNLLKVIIETCYLNEDEKITACQLSVEAGADFVKTSTGFGNAGANLKDVELMKKTVGNKAMVKASGGVRSLETAMDFINKGANRLGTSNGIAIMQGLISNKDY